MLKINWEDLEVQAMKTLKRAYSPYSRFQVGAAVLTSERKIYSGCNIENASYGGTVCAERVAIWKAVSEGQRNIVALLVITQQSEFIPPCGFCRQVLNEFAFNDCPVVMLSSKGVSQKTTLKTLLPEDFGPQHLLSR